MPYVVMCGTPNQHCTGGSLTTNAFLRSANPKGHSSHTEAYKCYRRYLVNVLEYKDLGGRVFQPPPGVNKGYLKVLGRKSKFGARLRVGKDRWMPKARGRSGVIICT